MATRHADLAFLQFEKRLINEAQLYGVLGPLRDIGKQVWANEIERSYLPGFVGYINAMMAEREPDSDVWSRKPAN